MSLRQVLGDALLDLDVDLLFPLHEIGFHLVSEGSVVLVIVVFGELKHLYQFLRKSLFFETALILHRSLRALRTYLLEDLFRRLRPSFESAILLKEAPHALSVACLLHFLLFLSLLL